MHISVSIADQKLQLIGDGGEVREEYPVSTSKFGIGTEPGSNHTPEGRFRIAHKYGHGAEPGTIFKSREPIGLWDAQPAEEDYVLSRILWLDGVEETNANTKDRYIYIHGTNQEELIGTPASHGCVRMTNAAVIDLFERVPEGTEVVIA